MKLRSKLLHPLALIGQGFLAGAALYTTAADLPSVQPLPSTVQSSVAPQIADI